MVLELDPHLVTQLLAQPENGMGWQSVEASFRVGGAARMLALNGSFLISGWEELRSVLTTKGVINETVLRGAIHRPSATLEAIRVLPPSHGLAVREAGYVGPASEAPVQATGNDHSSVAFRRSRTTCG